MSFDQNFDFTNPMKEVEVVEGKKHIYKKPVQNVLLNKGKPSLHNTIIGFILLALLTGALVYLLNQKAQLNQVKRNDRQTTSVSSNLVLNGANYEIVFNENPNFTLTKNTISATSLIQNSEVKKDIWSQKTEGGEQSVLQIESFANPQDLNFEKMTADFKIKNSFAENDVSYDETKQGFKRAKFGEKYEIIQSATNTYLIYLEGEQKGVQQAILENIQFN